MWVLGPDLAIPRPEDNTIRRVIGLLMRKRIGLWLLLALMVWSGLACNLSELATRLSTPTPGPAAQAEYLENVGEREILQASYEAQGGSSGGRSRDVGANRGNIGMICGFANVF